MRYNFEEIRLSKEVSGVCEVCGKRYKRTVSDWQTENPFNKNKDGTVKTRSEIRDAVWESVLRKCAKTPPVHIKCERAYTND